MVKKNKKSKVISSSASLGSKNKVDTPRSGRYKSKKKKSSTTKRTPVKLLRSHRTDNVDILRQLTIIAGLIALAAIVGVFIFLTNSKNSNYETALLLKTPDEEIVRSVPFEIEIGINNETNNFLSDVELTINLEEGLVSLGYGKEKTVIRNSIGNIGKGNLSKQSYQILPTAPAGSKPQISVTLLYSIGKTRFEKTAVAEIEIKKEALLINIEQPEQILVGSVFEIEVNYENISDFDFSNLHLEMQYPKNFEFVSANFQPSSFNNYWRLGTLKANSNGNLKINGILRNGDGELNFEASLLTVFQDQPYPAAKTENEFKTAKSPIYFETSIMGNRKYVAKIGDSLKYTINYRNESGIALKDVEIRAELIGKLFDFSTLTSEAKLDTLTNILLWDKNTNPELEVLEPSEEGAVIVNIALKNAFPVERLGDKNFSLKLNAEMESPSVPYYLSADKTSAGDVLKTNVAGLITVDAQGFYWDAPSGIANKGGLPPTVGESTEYTVHWVIRNHATDVKNVKISATLPEGVGWTGLVKSNINSVPIYNEADKKINWEIENIAANKGVINSPIEAIFQIEATPTPGKIGQFQPLLSNTQLTGEDQFTGLILKSSDVFLNTSLIDDKTVEISEGIVVR